MKKRLFLLEKFAPDLDLKGAMVISLDPAVSRDLDAIGQPYKILEDYYDEHALRAGERAYFSENLKWFNFFDRFLADHFSLCESSSIPLVKTNYLRFKYCVDTIIINAVILAHFFEQFPKIDISEIVYVRPAYPQQQLFSIFHFRDTNRWVFGQLLDILAAKHGIPCTHHDLSSGGRHLSQATVIRRSVFKQAIKTLVHLFKYGKIFRSRGLSKRKLFFMHAGGPDVDIPIRDCIRRGATVYLQDANKARLESSWHRPIRAIPNLASDEKGRFETEAKAACRALPTDPTILPWISQRCGFDVSHIVLPFLENFVSHDVPFILGEALRMSEFFRSKQISHVFARGNTDRDSLGALIAARYMKSAKSVCIEHASFASDNEAFGVFDIETYNLTLARDPVSEAFLKTSLTSRYPANCRVGRSMHYLQKFAPSNQKQCAPRKPEKIVFVEKKFSDRVRCFNNMNYPIAWYYEFQKELVNSWEPCCNFEFVYKSASPSPNHPILAHLKAKNMSHVSSFIRPFSSALEFADRVITDYPSGALFEAAVAGKPVLCLYANYVNVVPKAKEIFGRSLQPFRTIPEAIAIVQRFLNADPEQYRVSFPVDPANFTDIFEELTR